MIVLEPYQERAVAWLRTKKRAAVHSPAGSGKTIIAAAALDSVLRARVRPERLQIGWLANTVEQVVQAHKAMALFPAIAAKANVRVACAAAASDWSDCAALVTDECHHGPAEGWAEQIATCKGTIWGFTATPPEEGDERFPSYQAIFGDTFFTIEREEVGSRLVQAHVVTLTATDVGLRERIDEEIESMMRYRRRWWHPMETKMCQRILTDRNATPEKRAAAQAMLERFESQLWGQVAWGKIVEIGIVKNITRTHAAVQTALKHRNNHVLVLVNQIEHGQEIASRIPGSIPCHSKMGAKKRRNAVEAFRSGECWCLVGTTMFEEGFDAPICDVAIMVSGGRSSRATEQKTGRALRSFAGKSRGIIYDFEDKFHPLAAKHALLRRETYRKLGYAVE